ncbi:MAG TPA: ribbon-helix-helix protein, CopG family [Blastocatellia bacterium]|nr:ribbon-helix-helix protein, CopG family [Blastocatellia bacterium]
MSRTITVSDELYERLQAEARMRGLDSIEQLLEQLQITDPQSSRRKEVVRRIDSLRERLFARYGEMPDSVELLREDRAR